MLLPAPGREEGKEGEEIGGEGRPGPLQAEPGLRWELGRRDAGRARMEGGALREGQKPHKLASLFRRTGWAFFPGELDLIPLFTLPLPLARRSSQRG